MKVIVLAFIVLALLGSVAALRCYECTGCTTVSDANLVTCDASANGCTKISSQFAVVRACNSGISTDGCISNPAGDVCTCYTDACNDSKRVYAGTMVALLVSCISGYLLS